MRIFEIEARPLPDPTLVYLQCVDVTEHRDHRDADRPVRADGGHRRARRRTGARLQQPAVHQLATCRCWNGSNWCRTTPRRCCTSPRAIEAVEHGAAVAKSLLSFARSQPLTAVPVNLRRFVGRAPLTSSAEPSVQPSTLEVHADTISLDVIVDPNHLSSSC